LFSKPRLNLRSSIHWHLIVSGWDLDEQDLCATARSKCSAAVA
jgi:hypothetical protein